jgi:hypothetical protein
MRLFQSATIEKLNNLSAAAETRSLGIIGFIGEFASV